MRQAMRMVVLLLILAWAAVPCAATDTVNNTSTSVCALPVAPTTQTAPAATSTEPTDPDLVGQYGDPDDLITGNRSNHMIGGEPPTSQSSGIPPADALLLEAWLAWLQLQSLY